MKFIFDGEPICQKRPRFVKKLGIVYDPSARDKIRLQWELKKQKPTILKPPIKIKITAYMPIPKSLSCKKKKQLQHQHHIKKPDLDNIAKAYLDVMNGLVYKDDSHIAEITGKKIYAQHPRVEIEASSVQAIK